LPQHAGVVAGTPVDPRQHPAYVSLGEALREQRVDQAAALPGQLPRRAGVLDRRCPDLRQMPFRVNSRQPLTGPQGRTSQ
jgi:hypothetical protein